MAVTRIGMAARDQLVDHGDHLGDVIGGALVLSLVAVASDGSVTLLDSATHDLGGTSAGDLAVAVLDGGDVVVAYRLGCGTQARVMVARTTLDVVAGTLADTLSTPQAIEAGTSAQRRPRIAVREFPVGATLAWEASNSIRVRQLDAAGQPLGAVLSGYAATGTLGAGHHLYPLPDSPAFGLIISDTSSNGTGALASLELRCAL